MSLPHAVLPIKRRPPLEEVLPLTDKDELLLLLPEEEPLPLLLPCGLYALYTASACMEDSFQGESNQSKL